MSLEEDYELDDEDLDLDPVLIAADRAAVEAGGFLAYFKLAWNKDPLCVGDDLMMNWHIPIMCGALESALNGDTLALDVNVPPGSTKSTIFSVHFPVYAWIKDPSLRICNVSGADSLAKEFAERSLAIMESRWFKARWGTFKIRDGLRAAAGNYQNDKGGQRVSTGVGNNVVGRHFDIVIMDDLLKPQDMDKAPESVLARCEEIWGYVTKSFFRRAKNLATMRRICIMQRLHEADPSQHMRDTHSNCVHLCFPMEYDPDMHCSTPWGDDPRNEPGQLMFEEKFPQHTVDQAKLEMPEADYELQFNQKVVSVSGGDFKKEWFENLYEPSQLPSMGVWYLTVDANLKDRKSSDYLVAQVWLEARGNYYFVTQRRGQWDFEQGLQQIQEMLSQFPQLNELMIEDKANGTAIISSLKAQGLGKRIFPVNPEGGKRARAQACGPLFRRSIVWFPKGSVHTETLRAECMVFPKGKKDDQVDAMTQFLVEMLKRGNFGTQFKQAMHNVRAGKANNLISAMERLGQRADWMVRF